MYHLISKSAKANQLNEKTKENVQNNFKHNADYNQMMKFHISKENKVDKMTTQNTNLEQKYKD